MAKRRWIQRNLLKSSTAAYLAAIELHNKPNMPYRYEIVTLLLINAWELLLKTYVRRYINGKSIFEEDGGTIKFRIALKYCNDHINATYGKNSFTAINENLLLLEDYRNNVVHFYNDDLDPIVFSLIAKAALNYVEFLETYFNIDILSDEGLFILPLGFKLPFQPTEFLSKHSSSSSNFPETKAFIDKVVKVITNLRDLGVEESIVLGYGVHLESIKKVTNSDIIAALSKPQDADITITKTIKIQPTSDPGAHKVHITEEQLYDAYPLTYFEIVEQCRKRYENYSQNQTFNDLMKKVKQDPSMSYGRRLNPKKTGQPDKYLYARNVFDYLDKHYKQRNN